MSELSYTSKTKTLAAPAATAFNALSDMSRLEPMKDQLPPEALEKVKDMEFTPDAISFTADPVGRVTFKIIEREPNKTIKFGLEGVPIQANFWIQLVEKPETPGVSYMRLVLKADVPLMVKMMLGKKLDKVPEGLDQFADGIARAFG